MVDYKAKEEKEHPSSNILASAGLVISLGIVIIILGFLRGIGMEIPPAFLLGISTLSLSLILLELLKIEGKKIIIFQSIGLFILICLPNLNIIQEIKNETIIQYSDGMALAVMGITLILIGQKGLREILGVVTSNSNTIQEMADTMVDVSESYKKLVDEHIDLQKKFKELDEKLESK
ncbi:hypothetical protein [Solibacillus sp. FSL W7-1324]|uniref:hypothetical protein n=1 Tax=Solibacillus sp. FSL W7-1324 TaxID=2921701 RepID=UPI0030F7906D